MAAHIVLPWSTGSFLISRSGPWASTTGCVVSTSSPTSMNSSSASTAGAPGALHSDRYSASPRRTSRCLTKLFRSEDDDCRSKGDYGAKPPRAGDRQCRRRSARVFADGAAELLYAVGVHGRTAASGPQIAAARAERVRSLDPDIARVEREGVAAFDAVPLEALQKELRHRCIAVVRIEYIHVPGPKPGTLVHSPGGAVVLRRPLQDKACHGSTSGTPQSSKPPISRVTTPAPLARATAAIIRSSGAVGRPALRRAAKMSA